MTGFGDRRVRSFGAPAPAEAEPVAVDRPPVGVGQLFVDVTISPESLARIRAELTAAVRAAVVDGFASAAQQQQDPEQT